MSQAIAIRPAETMSEWETIRDQSSVLIKTGFLPQSIKTPEQAMAIILTGRELGIGTMAALNTINVIQGKPTVSPQLMLALINRSGQVEDIQITGDATSGITCMMKRRGRTAHSSHFGPKEAASMGLNSKDNYKKQPATMYKWRAVADCARAVFPDIILGLYTPDEMGAVTDIDGEVIAQPSTPLVIAPPATTEQTVEGETEEMITESQKHDLAALIDTLSGFSIADADILTGINKLTGSSITELEPTALSVLTGAQAAKVISAYNRRLDALQAEKERKSE